MKGSPLLQRIGFAFQGLRAAMVGEASFRFHVLAAVVAMMVTMWLHPALVWVAMVGIMIGLVLAAELFNTALEQTLDGLHAEHAEFVRIAKDCAAAAVLVLSMVAVGVFVAMLLDISGGIG